MDEQFDKLSKLLFKSKRLVILTGAGISTSSGLPDFRGDNGFWKANKPIDFQEFLSNSESRVTSWKRNIELNNKLREIKPNAGHFFVKKIIEEKPDSILITQNIDGLHQKSGLMKDKIVEIHGNATAAACLNCEKQFELEPFHKAVQNNTLIPNCDECDSLVKVATISFGQPMRKNDLDLATEFSQACDTFLVLGSSLIVEPVASLPLIALKNKASLLIINKGETPYDGIANVVLNEEISKIAEKFL